MPILQNTPALQELTSKISFPIADQLAAGQVLRTQAVTHLKSGEGLVGKNFRDINTSDYNTVKSQETFLAEQSEPNTYGEKYMLHALAELYQVNVRVVETDDSNSYFAMDYGVDYPTVTLQHTKGKAKAGSAWNINGESIIHNGACLFHSFAKGLSSLFLQNEHEVAAETNEAINSVPKINENILISWQRTLMPKSDVKTVEETKAEQILANQSDEIKAQIEADRLFALQLAEDEYNRPRCGA